MTFIRCNIYKYFQFTVFAKLLIKLFCVITVTFFDHHLEFVKLYQEDSTNDNIYVNSAALMLRKSNVHAL
jgi:hypothetical protein